MRGGRRVSTTLKWADPLAGGTSVRVRHVPSGRYLAVDTASGPCNNPDDLGGSSSGPNAERWYRVCLVDDAALDEDDYYHDGTNNNKDATAAARSPGGKTMLELDDGFKAVDPSRLEFHVARAVLLGQFGTD